MYQLVYSSLAEKDAKKLGTSPILKKKCKALLTLLAANPYQNPPPYEKLVGDLQGCFSRRINIQHRLIYEIFPKSKTVKVLRMWTHYE